MVYGVASKIVERAISGSGIRLIEKGVRAFQKYDVRIHRGLYGQAGGRGVRHGRDIGSVAAGLIREFSGDDLDVPSSSPYETGKFPKARHRQYRNRFSRYAKRNRHRTCRCKSRPRSKSYKSYNRMQY